MPEGDDKVHKYPLMFATSDAVVMHKYDMLPYFEFDDQRVECDAKGVNPDVSVFRVSSRTGEGMEALLTYLRARIDAVRAGQGIEKEGNS